MSINLFSRRSRLQGAALPLVTAVSTLSSALVLAQAAASAESQQATQRMEEMVITASRASQRLGNIAASVEVISASDMQELTGPYLTDVLKKGSSVDVIEYPGGLSGIGMRGFRPEFSGTNKRVLILLDGHPAGFTSVGTAMRASVGRVEVLKGSASALYGSSAMGGVVNFLSHQSQGPVEGQVALGTGSFSAFTADARAGGSLTEKLDFDLSYSERTQDDDYKMGKQRAVFGTFVQGDGARRPNTTFEHRSTYGRLKYALNEDWSVESHVHGYYSNDVYSPGAESDGITNVGLRDIKGHTLDVNLRGNVGNHSLYASVYASREADASLDVDAGRFQDGTRLTRYDGAQLQDSWQLSDTYTLLFGADYEENANTTKRFNPNGTLRAPFSPDDRREVWGTFAELTGKFLDERLILNAGVRYDDIKASVLATPLRPDLTPGETGVTTTNPRLGIVFLPQKVGPLRIHASAGTGFVTPLASQLAGLTDEVVGVQRRITRGNPNLSPEESTSYDIGVGYESNVLGADLTYFDMDNKNKIESVFVTNTATKRESTYVNASDASATGWELTLQGDPGLLLGGEGGAWLWEATSTYYTERTQNLPAGVSPLRNVARMKFNTSLGYTNGPASVRLSARHVNGMIDQDFSARRIFTNGAGGVFEYPEFTVFDVFASWSFNDQSQLNLQIDNLEDEYYYEKNDYPFAGRSYSLTYRHTF